MSVTGGQSSLAGMASNSSAGRPYVVRRQRPIVRDLQPAQSGPAEPKLSPHPCGVGHVEGEPCMWCHGTMWLLAENDAEPKKARHDPDAE